MLSVRLRYGARWLLAAAFAMLVETSCSHTPHRDEPVDQSQPWPHHALMRYEGLLVVVRIYDANNTVVATSDYAVNDSTVVVREFLKDGKYYPSDDKAVLRQMDVPFAIPLNHISKVERWEKPDSTWKLVGGVVLVGAAFWAIGRWATDNAFGW
jgi:hypothetical protein